GSSVGSKIVPKLTMGVLTLAGAAAAGLSVAWPATAATPQAVLLSATSSALDAGTANVTVSGVVSLGGSEGQETISGSGVEDFNSDSASLRLNVSIASEAVEETIQEFLVGG